MFTIEQIKAAHNNLSSGADFPVYVQNLMQIGVSGYETYSVDGHTNYFGYNEFTIETGPMYEPLIVSDERNKAQFQLDLKANQEGRTDFFAFCRDCAKSGVEKWIVDMADMTCTYYDKEGDPFLKETILTPSEDKRRSLSEVKS